MIDATACQACVTYWMEQQHGLAWGTCTITCSTAIVDAHVDRHCGRCTGAGLGFLLVSWVPHACD